MRDQVIVIKNHAILQGMIGGGGVRLVDLDEVQGRARTPIYLLLRRPDFAKGVWRVARAKGCAEWAGDASTSKVDEGCKPFPTKGVAFSYIF